MDRGHNARRASGSRLRHVRVIGTVLLLAGLLALTAPACAEIREARVSFVDGTAEGALLDARRLPPGLPARLARVRDVYLVVMTGGAYLDVRLLGRPETSPSRLAQYLERAAAGTALEGRPLAWEQAREFAAARVTLSRGRWGAREAETLVPVGRLAAGLREAGLRPHILLGVPRHAEASVPPFPRRAGETFHWYDAGAAAADLEIPVRARVTDRDTALAALFLGLFPLIALASILAAPWIGRAASFPPDDWRRLHPRLALWPAFAAVAGQFVLGGLYLRTPAARRLDDAWLGQGETGPLSEGLGFLLAYPSLWILGWALLVWRRCRPRDPAREAALSPDRRVIERKVELWDDACLILVLVLWAPMPWLGHTLLARPAVLFGLNLGMLLAPSLARLILEARAARREAAAGA